MSREGRYYIAELFYSLQGEGARKGSANVFVRFAGCNLVCTVEQHGFDCDTDFTARQTFPDAPSLVHAIEQLWGERARSNRWVILTGGEPTLQLDPELSCALFDADFSIAIETNGTKKIDRNLVDWISCSPKAGEPVHLTDADEVRFVLRDGQLPRSCRIECERWYVSPAFNGEEMDPASMKWCLDWCLENTGYRLSVQDHKLWGVR